jgi:hypothetical protein
MSPTSSFASELKAYRQRLLVSEHKVQPWFPAALKALDNWADHPGSEAIWTILKEKLPPEALPTAGHFIDLVLQQWVLAQAVDERERDDAKVVKNHVDRLKRHLRDENYGRLWREAKLLDDHIKVHKKVLRRKMGAAKTNFMAGWSFKFREQCGQPLDDVVRVLTEIAFGTEETTQSVRDKRRPTTKRGRDIRGRK